MPLLYLYVLHLNFNPMTVLEVVTSSRCGLTFIWRILAVATVEDSSAVRHSFCLVQMRLTGMEPGASCCILTFLLQDILDRICYGLEFCMYGSHDPQTLCT